MPNRFSKCILGLQDRLPFKYDLEKIIDDWILMGFLVGNDFLPHLPNMHIRQVKGHHPEMTLWCKLFVVCDV